MRLDDERLDAAVDEAARRMTAGEPGPEFRRRVMARIDRKRSTPAWSVAIASVAAAAVVVVAVVLLRHAPSTPLPRATQTADRPGTSSTPSNALPQPEAQVMQEAITSRSRPRATTAASGGGTAETVPRADIDPLTTPSIDLASIAIPRLPAESSIGIQPLPIAPIAMEPLGIENQGD
jgi:hypothetical protein